MVNNLTEGVSVIFRIFLALFGGSAVLPILWFIHVALPWDLLEEFLENVEELLDRLAE